MLTFILHHRGFFAMILVFLFFSMQQMRDGIFVRPHPAFWRIVMGCAVLYLLGCVYMLFQVRFASHFKSTIRSSYETNQETHINNDWLNFIY